MYERLMGDTEMLLVTSSHQSSLSRSCVGGVASGQRLLNYGRKTDISRTTFESIEVYDKPMFS